MYFIMEKYVIKIGRILIGLSIGTIIGICSGGERNIEKFAGLIFLAVFTVIASGIMIIATKSEKKLEDLQATNNTEKMRTCPVCGLNLSDDCKKCPKCNTEL